MALKLVVGSELISPKLKAAMDSAVDQTGGDPKQQPKSCQAWREMMLIY
jgi:hypothetical protein